jgi:hypothetical protein
MKHLGFGAEYVYPPDVAYVTDQTYLPPELCGRKFFVRTPVGGGVPRARAPDAPSAVPSPLKRQKQQ